MNPSKATPVERGCGRRVKGGCYAECGTGPSGSPIEDFLIDPPHIIADPAALGLTPRGVKLIEVEGTWHVVDWIGSQHYPNVSDFVEEARRYGLSRRLSRNLDLSKLNEQSRILLVHARAHIENFHDYVWCAGGWVHVKYSRCPTKHPEHDQTDPPLMCAGVWWQDIEGGEFPLGSSESQNVNPRVVHRAMPSFAYIAACRPNGVQPHYQAAIFASFPISRIAVVRDPDGNTHDDTANKARKSSLPVELEDE